MPRKSNDADYVNKVSQSNPSKDPPPPVRTVQDFPKMEIPERDSTPNHLLPEETVNPAALFERFFDTQIISLLVQCTNGYATQFGSRFIEQKGKDYDPQNHRPWTPMTTDEMYAYLGRNLINKMLVK